MNFRIDATLPSGVDKLWRLFFDLPRIAALIPGCESVEEKEPHASYAALLNQKIGPFKMSVPTEIRVEERCEPSHVRLRATGRDKYTGTRLDVLLSVDLEPLAGGATRLGIDSTLQVSGRLASLGYPVVKKKSEELFAEFERRLRAELESA
jgi:carbon monoxide dehydrogenase subunit G